MTTVPDLIAAIRERLALDEDGQYFRYDSEMIQGVLFAVLNLHAAFDNPQHPLHPWCGGCNDYHHLCPTRLAIAEKLGIET